MISRSKSLLSAALFLAGSSLAFGYALEGPKWLGPNIPMVVQVGPSAAVLPDGFINWNVDAENCFQIWNEQIANVQFTWSEAPTSTPTAFHDGKNQVQFAKSVYGKSFGSGVLAVTTYDFIGSSMTEADVLFKAANEWSSGVRLPASVDFHRVALHEFGHVLGLAHPDKAKPAQTVEAIMNSIVSGLNHLTSDDVAGARFLYGVPTNPPPVVGAAKLANISTRSRVGVGNNVLIAGFIIHDQTKSVLIRALGPSLSNFNIAGPLTDPSMTLHNGSGSLISSNDNWKDTQQAQIQQTTLAPSNDVESAIFASLPPSNYTAVISGRDGGSGVALAEVYDLTPPAGRVYNISTRAQISGGENVMIAGFIVKGPQLKNLVIRGIGPGLQGLVPGAVPDTQIELRNSANQLLVSNTGWQNDPRPAIVSFYRLAPSNVKDSAFYTQLAPGSYTVVMRSPSGATGIGLVEVYGVD